jgi:hypothetical protein
MLDIRCCMLVEKPFVEAIIRLFANPRIRSNITMS